MSVYSEVQRILDDTTTIKNHLNSLGVQGNNLRGIAENVNVLVKPDIEGILGNFAGIESTDTASKKIDKGRCVVYNGLLYKAKSDIQQGNTLVVDGNIERTTVGDEISSLNTELSQLFAETPFSKEITIAAGGNFDGTVEINKPSGYTFFSVSSFTTGSSSTVIVGVLKNSDQSIYVACKNISNQSITTTVSGIVKWIKG